MRKDSSPKKKQAESWRPKGQNRKKKKKTTTKKKKKTEEELENERGRS